MATKTRHFPLRFYELFFFPFSYHFFKLERQIETEYRDISFHDKFGFFPFPNCIFVFDIYLRFFLQLFVYFLEICFWLQQQQLWQGGFCLHFKEVAVFFSQAGFFLLICFDFFSLDIFFSKSHQTSLLFFFGFLPRQVESHFSSGQKLDSFFTEKLRQDWLIF